MKKKLIVSWTIFIVIAIVTLIALNNGNYPVVIIGILLASIIGSVLESIYKKMPEDLSKQEKLDEIMYKMESIFGLNDDNNAATQSTS